MKLHPLISARSFHMQTSASTSSSQETSFGISPQLSLGCVQGCVGTSAASTCAHCGGDASCWDDCAGAGKGACVLNCV